MCSLVGVQFCFGIDSIDILHVVKYMVLCGNLKMQMFFELAGGSNVSMVIE